MTKAVALLSGIFLCWCCSLSTAGLQPPTVNVRRYDPGLYHNQDHWWYKGQLFSGYIIQEQGKLVVYKMPVVQGLASGKALSYYENGHAMLEESFANDQLNGLYRHWWRNGQYRYLFFYKNNQYEGRQQVFFENGRLREEANYQAGKLEGLQRVWDEQGQLVSNYTIRNNERYGIVRAESCIPGDGH